MTPADRALVDKMRARVSDAYWSAPPDAVPDYSMLVPIVPEPRRPSLFARLWLRVRLWWWS